MKFIHLSDIHLTVPGEMIGALDPHERFNQALTHCLAHHPDAERLIITGDLAHWGEVEAYEALKEKVTNFPIQVRLLLGNHDNRDNFLSVFTEHPHDDKGFVFYGESVGGLDFVYCDTNEPLTHGGRLDVARRETLHGILTSSEAPAVLFMHHNPGPTGMAAVDSIGLLEEDSTKLADLLRTHRGRIRHIFFGHTHLTLSGSYAGIPYSCVSSTVHQGLPNFSNDGWLHGGEFQPHYAVVSINGDQTAITHVPFAYDGPIRRSGTAWEDWTKPESAA